MCNDQGGAMTHRLDIFDSDQVLFELLRTRVIDWQAVLVAGGVDPLEAEHRDLLELQCRGGSVVIVSQPL